EVDCVCFQAEDGLRDFHVTGVQTCALPIFDDDVHYIPYFQHRLRHISKWEAVNIEKYLIVYILCIQIQIAQRTISKSKITLIQRSEERRVGKEWRTRRGQAG